MNVTITPRRLAGSITPPPSKSQAHRLIIAAALARFPGDRKRAMEALGLSRRTFYRKLSQHRL